MVLPPSMQSSLPAGWLTFTGRVLNPLDRYKRFKIIHPPFLDFAWRKGSFIFEPPSRFYGRRGQSASPLPVALVEGRRRAQPGTPDTLGTRKAKVLHQVN